MAQTTAKASVLLTHDVGLHARPSVTLTKLAKTFAATITLTTRENGAAVNAKSIVKVMAMKAPANTTLVFEAVGEDAEAAVTALVDLVHGDFEVEAVNAGHD
ncbi:DHA-specific phosphocarrier protein HPr [hydrothermal vent metagenome]|uniref:Phosphocarrier protein HPr n=1 Tax=hydrothermal vent metagenome TaxID=652676 RepID=A0A3B0TRN2_9ZZZZ